MLNKVNHIGIAVRSIENSLLYYEKVLGLKCDHIEEVTSEKVKVAFLQIGDIRLELLESTDSESPIAKFIESKGEGIHHLAFESSNLIVDLENAKNNGVRLINETPKTGAHNNDIAFLHPKSSFGVLTEFCQPKHQ